MVIAKRFIITLTGKSPLSKKVRLMKTTPFAALCIVMVGFFAVFSQQDTLHLKLKKSLAENDEYLHALEAMDKNVIENAKVLVHNLQTKKALFLQTANYHSDEIGRSLASSEDYLTKLQKVTDIAMDEIQIAYYAGLHQHYRNAINAHETLKAELAKASPTNSVIEMNALTIYSEITKADNEQKEMQHKMNIKEPAIHGLGK
jgi:anion-transporting  ArsA/GET3 family ATPase